VSGGSAIPGHRRKRAQRQDRGQQIAKRRRVGKLGRNPRVRGSRGKEHQAQVSEAVEQQNWHQHRTWSELVEPRQDVQPGGDPEQQRAEQ
jgi:hypothetical protein